MSGEIFDPEIHATDKDGNPSLNKDGSFRKKRRDAGNTKQASAPKAASPAGRAEQDRRAGYRKSVADTLAVPVTLVSLADPVMGFVGQEIAPLWADALADLAMEQPRLAAVLERAGGLGAVGGLVGVGMLTVVQFGYLAGKVPAHLATMFGAKSRTEIEQILEQRGVKLRAEAEERRRAEAAEAEELARYQERVAEREAAEAEERAQGYQEHGYASAV